MPIDTKPPVHIPLDEQAMMTQYLESLDAERRAKLAANADLIRNFSDYALAKGIVLSNADFDYYPKIGIIAQQRGIFWKLANELQRDKDGLVQFSDLRARFPHTGYMAGYLRGEQFTAMVHPHFRRGLYAGNNFAPLFVDRFWQMQTQMRTEKSAAFIAVDEDRVRIEQDDLCYAELDTWYGAKFSEDVAQIPVGITKLRPPLDISESQIHFFFRDAYSLQIAWSRLGTIKTFQGIEFKSNSVRISVDGTDYFPARYVHAEFDLQRGVFRHLDGAMQYYTEAEYLQRRDSDFNHNAKNLNHLKARSRKLFKFNCDLQAAVMSDLSSHFWTGNPLAIEYFSGAYPPNIDEAIARIRQQNAI